EKAFLRIGNRTIIDLISAALKPLTGEIIIVSNNPALYNGYGVKVVRDVLPGHGPLSGIHAGLLHITNRMALVTACDTPFVSVNLARLLIAEAADYDLVIPRYRGFLEPLFALYSQSCRDFFELSLKKGHNKITRTLENLALTGLRIRYLEEEELRVAEPNLERTFLNVNTPVDLARAQSIAGD
ncbi:MAG: molybdenum cofactor guanylyltransferase, partial [Firmicutes bacterium]|nr:molybdenum cofactor guanylyltransferase [Bacillota bacterium]